MNISINIFEAYLHCPTKCWLLSRGEVGEKNVYADWMREKNKAYHINGIKRLSEGIPPKEFLANPPANLNLKTASWSLVSEMTVSSKGFESCVHAVERTPSAGRGKPAQYVPIRFVTNNKLTKFDKLMIAFDVHIFTEALSREITQGKIIHGDGFSTLKIKPALLVGAVQKLNGKISSLISATTPPDLILNRHCPECDFQSRCREKANEKDDLSLLGSMTEKERKKLNDMGIFTIKQLSYTFRPRRRPNRLRDNKEKYHHSLKALAIRENKIHIVGSPELKIDGTPVYLDVEGLPDRDFYYLIGLRFKAGDAVVQHSLWADSTEDEKTIWQEFLELLGSIENPVLIHYGSYETIFFRTMLSRYGASCNSSIQTCEVSKTSQVSPEINATLIANEDKKSNAEKIVSSATNVLTYTYGRVYFPVFSNGLKDVAGYIGFRWSENRASGLQSIVWRELWETSREVPNKEKLLRYNAEDCEALEVLVGKLFSLQNSETSGKLTSEADVVDVSKQKREHPYGFKRNHFVISDFEIINAAAYWDYQRERVYLKTNPALKNRPDKLPVTSKPLAPNQIIMCQRPIVCPKCGSINFWQNAKHNRTITDLKFLRNGVKRWITKYNYQQYLCNDCGKTFLSIPVKSKSHYKTELLAYSIYQCIELRMPIMTIDKCNNKIFDLRLPEGTTNRFKTYASKSYETTYNALLTKLCNGNLIHADETKIGLRVGDGFVWVFTSMEEVAYVYTKTREGNFVQNYLKDFKGVLLSDFYAAYDSIECPQQKCLIHLIRDINDALYKHPYDEGLKRLAEQFASLLQPMIETVHRFGLKHHFLKKHISSVELFYKGLLPLDLVTETAIKIRERFEKNRDKLFTFLNYDGIPWNNNNAEHAVKPFAMLRHIIKGLTTEKSLQEYLILLSVCETCKYRGLDFLDFLRSGEKDIDVFAASRQRRRKNTKQMQTCEVSENIAGLVVPS